MKRLSVTNQIIIFIISMSIMGIGVGLFGIFKISESNSKLNSVFEDAFLPTHDLNSISHSFSTIIYWELEKLHNKESQIEITQNLIDNEFKKVEELLDKLLSEQNKADEFFYFKDLKQQTTSLKIAIRNLLSSYDSNNINVEYYNIVKSIRTLQTTIDVLIDIQMNDAIQIKRENEVNFNKSKLNFLGILFLGIGASMALALFTLIGIKAHLASTNRLIRKIASGDLSTDIVRRGAKDFGELQENLRTLSEKFSKILDLSHTAANNISITSEELSSNAQMISDDANQQAVTVEEIASSMEQISSRVQENNDNTLSTQIIYAKVAADVELGSDNVKQTLEAIQSIANKISIIGDIAFQTNILALNAAVEAARAGEHGKGFGVVAAEVGKLAERSKSAATEINTLSQSGLNLALKSRQLLIQFVAEIGETSSLISHITNANLEQNSGISEMNTAIQMLNQIAQQNAAASEEMATVSEQMTTQSQLLKESIHYFKFRKQTEAPKKTTKYLRLATSSHNK